MTSDGIVRAFNDQAHSTIKQLSQHGKFTHDGVRSAHILDSCTAYSSRRFPDNVPVIMHNHAVHIQLINALSDISNRRLIPVLKLDYRANINSFTTGFLLQEERHISRFQMYELIKKTFTHLSSITIFLSIRYPGRFFATWAVFSVKNATFTGKRAFKKSSNSGNLFSMKTR